MSRHRARVRALLCGVLLAAPLAALGACDDADQKRSGTEPAANGVTDLDPPAALRRALRVHRSLKDASYKGHYAFLFPAGIRAVDLTMSATANGACTMRISSPLIGHLDVRVLGKYAYLKGDEKALADVFGIPPNTLDIFKGRWFKGPVVPEVAAVCTRSTVLPGDTEVDGCQPGGTGEVDHVATVVVRCFSRSAEQHIQIAATGRPLVMRVEGTVPGRFWLELTSTDSGVEVREPPARDVIDTEAFE